MPPDSLKRESPKIHINSQPTPDWRMRYGLTRALWRPVRPPKSVTKTSSNAAWAVLETITPPSSYYALAVKSPQDWDW